LGIYEQEDKEIDRDHKMHVTLPNEKDYEDLHGPVKTYRISELEDEENESNQPKQRR